MCMIDYRLPEKELGELRQAHRESRDKRSAYRINAVILLASGWSAEQVAQALLIDPDTARNYFKRYKQGGLTPLLQVAYRGSEPFLDDFELTQLKLRLKEQPPLSAQEIVGWVAENFGVNYTESGMIALLHRIGYVYKKAKLIPGKADPQQQIKFLDEYKKIKENKGEHDRIYFMDAVHPQHNPTASYVWTERGSECEIPTNTGRKRLNINGAIDIEKMEAVISYEKTINADAAIFLLQEIERENLTAGTIWIICDNARYYRSKAVSEYLKDSKIKLVFLPAYSPNLNLIERFWKFFKRKVTYNKYYGTFNEFKYACEDFFDSLEQYALQLRSLLTENFQIIGC